MIDSVYVLECVCGATIRSHTTEAICTNCKRAARIEWKEKSGPDKPTREESIN